MDNKIVGYVASGLAALVGVLGAIYSIIIIANGNPTNYNEFDYASLDAMSAAQSSAVSTISSALTLTNWSLILAVVLTLGFGLYYLATNIKTQIPFIIGTIALVVIVFIGYGMGDDVIPSNNPEILENTTAGEAKMVDAGIYSVYILFLVAIGSMVVFGVKNALSKFSK